MKSVLPSVRITSSEVRAALEEDGRLLNVAALEDFLQMKGWCICTEEVKPEAENKRYAAGVLPVCRDEEGKQHVLFGLQPRLDGRAEVLMPGADPSAVKGAFCCFWGWSDQGDFGSEGTAAREATEESSGLLGSARDIFEHLKRGKSSEFLPELFVLNLGTLTKAARLAMCDEFFQLRFKTSGLSRAEREMACVKWIVLDDLIQSIEADQITCKGMLPNQRIRKFLFNWMRQTKEVWRELDNENFPLYDIQSKVKLSCSVCKTLLLRQERSYRTGICNGCYDANKH
jgi:hypothetical protein